MQIDRLPPNSVSHQPSGLYILAFAELWDRYSYYGIQALLVLYLTKAFLFTDSKAYVLYGAYTALTFAAPVIGGLVADKFLGFHRAILIGAILIICGNAILAFSGLDALYIGLGVMVCGIGLFKPNNTSLVGSFYRKEDIRRDSGFTIFYIGMNIGALLGPIAYGYIAFNYGWHLSFITSAFGSSMGLIFILLNFNKLKVETSHTLLSSWIVCPSILTIIGLFTLFLHYPELLGNLLYMSGIIVLLSLIIVAVCSETRERNHIFAIIMLSFFCIFYFACSLQTATSLTLFIERNIDRNLLSWQIPTMMFLSLEPFFIIMLAPMIARAWLWLARHKLEPSVPLKVTLGLFFAGISFAIFSMAAQGVNATHQGSMIGIILGNIFLGLGELCILPVVMSAITKYAPVTLRGTLMGVFFLALAFSGYFSGIIAKLLSVRNVIESGNKIINYAYGFHQISYVAIGISLVMLCLTPWIKRLMMDEPRDLSCFENLAHPPKKSRE